MGWLSRLVDGPPVGISPESRLSRQDQNLARKAARRGASARMSGSVAKGIQQEAARRGVKSKYSFNTGEGTRVAFPAGRGYEVLVTFDSNGTPVSQIEQAVIDTHGQYGPQ